MLTVKELPFKNISTYGKSTQKLGQGGFGEVQLYVDDKGMEYAVKTMKNSYGDGIEEASLREISILNKLSHPNIVNIFDVTLNVDNTIIIMEAAVTDLSNYMKSNTLSADEIVVFMYQLAKGLEYLHSQTVWHRDIKPHNLLVFADGTIKYTDFGVSRFGALPNNKYTDEVTSLLWRPPEILLGSSFYGPEADIWSLGIVFGQMVRNKYVIYDDNEQGVLEKIVLRIGRMTEKDWPGISGMLNFKYISNINEQHPQGSIFSKQIVKDKLGDVVTDLLYKMLTPNPSHRISIRDIVNHPYFNPVRADLDRKYNYQTISPMVCGNIRILDDLEPSKAIYERKITPSMIEILFEWLADVLKQYDLSPQTLFYARNLFDKYVKVTNSGIKKSELQLFGLVSLLVSSKIFDIFSPSATDMAHISANTYSLDRIKKAERELLTKLKFQLMFPNIHEYISYYNENTVQSIIVDAEILGRILMIDESIPNNYANHVIAETLVYIVAKGNGEFPKCLNANKKDDYEILGNKIIDNVQRIEKKFGINRIFKSKEIDAFHDIINKWTTPAERVESPLTTRLTETIPEGIRMSLDIGITFIAVKDEDVTRQNLFEFANYYVMNEAENFANSDTISKISRPKFADYFNFDQGPSGKYYLTKTKLDKISYDLGKFTVKTTVKVNFNNVPIELESVFKFFFNKLLKPTKFSTITLFGHINPIN